MLEKIISDIRATAKPISDHNDFPICPGIYAFILKADCTLKNLGSEHQIIYVGIVKESLKVRDLGNHFNDKGTGSSSLRRSIGAILKEDLNLTAISRNNTANPCEINHYNFVDPGNVVISEWMLNNLLVGYWKDKYATPYSQLRDLEKEVTKILKPTLDLDSRTKKFNFLAPDLSKLRMICRTEALSYAKIGKKSNL